jgi:hypothetical protein
MTIFGFKAVVVLFAVIVPSAFGDDIERVSRAFGKRYTTLIPVDELARTPRWKIDEENPPVSARKAITLADALREKIVEDAERIKWKLESASIVFFGDDGLCYWKIRYRARITQPRFKGFVPDIDLFVLMDGTSIEPVVTDQK